MTGGKKMERPKWVITTDPETLRKALRGMMGMRGMIQESLAKAMGNRNLFSPFLSGKQHDLRISSFLAALEAMDYQMVIMEREDSKAQRRLAQAREEGAQRRANEEAQRALTAVDPDRDERGKLVRKLTEQEKAQTEDLLRGISERFG